MDWASSSKLRTATAPERGLAGILRGAGRRLMGLPRALAWVLVLGWMALVWFGSSRASRPDALSSGLHPFLGNLAHALEFGLFALWLLLLVRRSEGWVRLDPPAVARVLSVIVLYALVDETHQSFVPGREASLLDVLTDVVGAVCVLVIVAYLGRPALSGRGLALRLLLGLAACAVAAGLSTLWGIAFETGLWPV